LRDLAEIDDNGHYVVCGGGYTGVELASNLNYLFKRRKSRNRVSIVEHGPNLCKALSTKQIAFIENAVRRAGIEVKSEQQWQVLIRTDYGLLMEQ
jgi:NADH dehydrogenase FAD-containing subunit